MSGLVVQGKFAVPVDRAAVAADWQSKGYSCDLFIDPPGQEWNGFVHSTNEYVTVTEGRLRMISKTGSNCLKLISASTILTTKGTLSLWPLEFFISCDQRSFG